MRRSLYARTYLRTEVSNSQPVPQHTTRVNNNTRATTATLALHSHDQQSKPKTWVETAAARRRRVKCYRKKEPTPEQIIKAVTSLQGVATVIALRSDWCVSLSVSCICQANKYRWVENTSEEHDTAVRMIMFEAGAWRKSRKTSYIPTSSVNINIKHKKSTYQRFFNHMH